MWEVVFSYFSILAIQLGHIVAFKIISEYEDKIKWRNVLWIIVTSLIITGCGVLKLNVLNSLFSIFLIFLIYYIVFKKSVKETIYYGFVIWLTGMIIDVIIMLKNLFLHIEIADIYLMRAIDTFILVWLLILIVNIKPFKKGMKKLYKKIEKQDFSYLKIIFIIAMILILGFTLRDCVLASKANNNLIVLIIMTLILIFLYINKEYTNFSLNQTEKQLIKNNEFYMEVISEYKILKHNIIHQLNGIKSVSNKQSIELIDDIIQEYNKKFTTTSNINKMPVGINGLVYEKVYSFNNKKLKLEIDNNIESKIFDNLTPRSYNLLCEALGILLDNALEAASNSKEKIIMIDMNENENVYCVKIINTFSNHLDIEQLGSLNYTTKDSGHGIGLFSLFGRKKLKIKTSIINNLFQNEIMVEKKK